MKYTLYDRLLRRELGFASRYNTVKGIYGDQAWIVDLDIVDELGGHSGCVNALCWSSSGRLLASGSDDQHLNIHSYQPESSDSQFALTTSVSTGHSANIFSVKFMPHSNDSTLVTCAGDSEVRVFDIEYNGRSASFGRTNIATSRRAQSLGTLYKGVRYLSYGDTNTRIYRSHADRVKRIVTESSPNLFLTCSEDGEVRQFDLRQPSSAYPPPKGGRGLLAHRTHHDDSNVPPPLISYKRYNLDLNTISCSASQPHYIALGGAHLHCFLHDRRMTGRDFLEERGSPRNASLANSLSSHEDELMGQATRCVRKFAPNGQKRMQRTDNGHITACKISDANPNELIASWSGDYIYSFDIIRAADSIANTPKDAYDRLNLSKKGKVKESIDRKRKRKNQNSSVSADSTRPSSKPKSTTSSGKENGDLSIRVRYENGQSEDIPMEDHSPSISRLMGNETRELGLNESQRRSLRISTAAVKIRALMFSLDIHDRTSLEVTQTEHTSHTKSFSSIISLAADCISEMGEVITSWGYPMNPQREDVLLQQTLRSNRESSRRFIQASGTLARLLGGKLETLTSEYPDELQLFQQIKSAPYEDPNISGLQIFSIEFLKAITLWLDGGVNAILQGFKRPKNQRLDNPRFPVPDNAQISGIDDYVIPYLLRLAQGTSILNVDASRFEKDENRKIFETDTAAVIALSHAIRIPLEDLSTAIIPASRDPTDNTLPKAQDRGTALRFWGFKVGRGVLMNAGKGINFNFVDTAFGGLGTAQIDDGRVQDEIELDDMEDVVESISLVKRPSYEENGRLINADPQHGESPVQRETEYENPSSIGLGSQDDADADAEAGDSCSGSEAVLLGDIHNELIDQMDEGFDNEESDDDEEDEDDERDQDEPDGDEDDHGVTAEERHLLFESASDRGKLRESVEANVTCSKHTRQYQGHCNIKTVKDVNFFGLQDEYVVSGSDSGHLFIWDKKTTTLVNILEGDSEIVNVVQGHPYEPLLAVSGIDHTIKIFSPDIRAQEDAFSGIRSGSLSDDSFRTTSTMDRRNRRNANKDPRNTIEPLSSRKRMDQSYQITSQNDVERQGGMRDAFITRGMLAQLAARLQATQSGGENGDVGTGMQIVIDDNCLIM